MHESELCGCSVGISYFTIGLQDGLTWIRIWETTSWQSQTGHDNTLKYSPELLSLGAAYLHIMVEVERFSPELLLLWT
jgi:hypothetical protein